MREHSGFGRVLGVGHGFGAQLWMLRYALVGADDIVYKPLSGKNLRGRVNQLIEARRR